ncbi:MAG: hypothetical protein MPK62_08085, partial [Alphaproteobacteria bacterium]|nr:hypothetical protein [Alphaproteobacteria bacterium]
MKHRFMRRIGKEPHDSVRSDALVVVHRIKDGRFHDIGRDVDGSDGSADYAEERIQCLQSRLVSRSVAKIVIKRTPCLLYTS